MTVMETVGQPLQQTAVRFGLALARTGRQLAEADWINTLHALVPRLQLAAGTTGTHHTRRSSSRRLPGVPMNWRTT